MPVRNLDLAWRTLEAGKPSRGAVRSLVDLGVADPRIMLGLESGHRELLLPAGDDIELRGLPRARGIKLAIRSLSVAEATRTLVLRCVDPAFHAIFARFATNLLEHVSESGDPAAAAIDAFIAWQAMFNRPGARSQAALLGLYGELHELRGLVDRDARALHTWVGPQRKPQDFIGPGGALEVKTSRTAASEVEIHGLEQLWVQPGQELVLAVKHVSPGPVGESLAEIVVDIVGRGADRVALDEALENFALDPQTLSSLETRFAIRGSRYFLVTPMAPAITPDLVRLPRGVSQLQYRVALDSPGFEELSGAALDSFLTRLARP